MILGYFVETRSCCRALVYILTLIDDELHPEENDDKDDDENDNFDDNDDD